MKRSGSRKASAISAAAPESRSTPSLPKVPEIVRPSLQLSVSESDIAGLNKHEQPVDVAGAVAELLHLPQSDSDIQEAALLDVYAYLYSRTRQQCYPTWLQAFALTMQKTLIEQIREGGSFEEVCETYKKLALDLAECAQAHESTRAGVKAHTWLLSKSEDLLVTVRNSVLQHYQLIRYMFTQQQEEVPSKRSYRIHTPIPSDVDCKHFLPHLDEALELELWNKARGIVTEPEAAATVSGREPESRVASTDPATAAHAGAAEDPKTVPTDLEHLLGQFTLEEIQQITENTVQDVLADYERKVKVSVADRQKRLATKLEKVKKK